MRALFWIVLVACSGTSSQANRETSPPNASGDTPPPGPSERECEALTAHAIDLAIEERKRTRPQDPPITPAERERVAHQLHPLTADCRGLTRERYRCGLQATTTEQLSRCSATRTLPDAK
jgi:hypothetical protein